MKNLNGYNKVDKNKFIKTIIITVLMVVLYSMSIVGNFFEYGRHLMHVSFFVLLFIIVFERKGKLIICNIGFMVYVLTFAIFCIISSLWAIDKTYAFSTGINVLIVVLVVCLTCMYYNNGDYINEMINIIMWRGNIICISVMFAYGVNGFLNLFLASQRILTDYINANTLGMAATSALLITVYHMIYERFRWYYLCSFPSFIALIISGSRKAIILFVIGVFFLILAKEERKENNVVNKIIAFILIVIVGFLLLRLSSKVGFLSSIRVRLESMVSFVINNSEEHSMNERSRMVKEGLELFRQHPIIGVGIDCARFAVSKMYMGVGVWQETYLHNNYIELLADVGIVGFIIYYSLYFIMLAYMIKNKNMKDNEYCICFMLLILSLLGDIGGVFYFERSTYFNALVVYLYIKKTKHFDVCNLPVKKEG